MDVSLHIFSPKLEREIPADYIFFPFSIFTEVFLSVSLPSFFWYEAFSMEGIEK